MSQSAFERYGGFANVSRLVTLFYNKVLDEPKLAVFFENTDMKRQIDHQTKFVSSLLGGPASYTNEELERVHARLPIDQECFDLMYDLLEEALEDFDVEPDDINEVLQKFKSHGHLVIKH